MSISATAVPGNLLQLRPRAAARLRIIPPPLGLRPGEWVQVAGESEILATLDNNGTLDGLPFMPEMRPFCGRRFRVKARADRTCAEVIRYRRMADAVHLEDVRCDGAEHDGCRRGCLIFWKEAWLRRATPVAARAPGAGLFRPPALRTRDGDRYVCQATELHRATAPLSPRDVRPLVSALWTEDLSPIDLLRSVAIFGYDNLCARFGSSHEWNLLAGPCTKTPVESLGLQPGERVRVKGRREILATLDRNGWNRKMEFSREMLPYCGKEFTVLWRVDRIIRDHTGRMTEVKNAVVLDGLVYKALNRLACPRGEYMFWRECWLERVGPVTPAGPAVSRG